MMTSSNVRNDFDREERTQCVQVIDGELEQSGVLRASFRAGFDLQFITKIPRQRTGSSVNGF